MALSNLELSSIFSKNKKNRSYYNSQLGVFYSSIIKEEDSVLIIGDFLFDLKSKSINFKNIIFIESKDINSENFIRENIIYENFDYIIINLNIKNFELQDLLALLSKYCKPKTRIFINKYLYGLSNKIIENISSLENFKLISYGRNIILPFYVPAISWFLNNIIANLPVINYFCFNKWFMLRKIESYNSKNSNSKNYRELSVSVIVPCRNEKGNIEAIVRDMPKLLSKTEIIFVEGHSKDGTLAEIERVINQYSEKDVKCFVQSGKGKNDAVRLGFSKASGDILLIFDSDITVSGKDLPKLCNALINNKAEFINASRLVYSMEKGAMPVLNYFVNYSFAIIVSWILGQKVTDTLCGTKVLYKKDWENIEKENLLSEDPFGDFNLLFGACKLNLHIVDIPVRYKRRVYGVTQIKKFFNGLLLLKLCFIGFKRLKCKLIKA